MFKSDENCTNPVRRCSMNSEQVRHKENHRYVIGKELKLRLTWAGKGFLQSAQFGVLDVSPRRVPHQATRSRIDQIPLKLHCDVTSYPAWKIVPMGILSFWFLHCHSVCHGRVLNVPMLSLFSSSPPISYQLLHVCFLSIHTLYNNIFWSFVYCLSLSHNHLPTTVECKECFPLGFSPTLSFPLMLLFFWVVILLLSVMCQALDSALYAHISFNVYTKNSK